MDTTEINKISIVLHITEHGYISWGKDKIFWKDNWSIHNEYFLGYCRTLKENEEDYKRENY